VLTNWAGNHRYVAAGLERPRSVEELQDVVAWAKRVRALGSRHSFTDIGDTEGVLVSLEDVPVDPVLDESAATVSVGGGARYGDVAVWLQQRGWALGNLASLPHISVAGAVATSTHGSGNTNPSLAAAVSGMDVVGPDGTLRHLARGEGDFDGSVVALGALGVVARLTLDVEPTFDIRQDVYLDLAWEVALDHLDAVMGSAYSVSLVTDLCGDTIPQAWLKSRGTTPPESLFGATPAVRTTPMLPGAPTDALTGQLGVPGPWLERLPHYRMEFTPSRGEELQTEYLVPRQHAVTALGAARALGEHLAPLLQVAEIRSVASDPLWLSSSYGTDTIGLHLTWERRPDEVYAVLPALEEVLLPLGARPHWGKCFTATADDLAALYPRLDDFRELRSRTDPLDKFGNAFLDRVLGPTTPASRPGSWATGQAGTAYVKSVFPAREPGRGK